MHRSLGIMGGIVVLVWVNVAHAAGDAQAGEAVFKKTCAVCHTTEEGKKKLAATKWLGFAEYDQAALMAIGTWLGL